MRIHYHLKLACVMHVTWLFPINPPLTLFRSVGATTNYYYYFAKLPFLQVPDALGASHVTSWHLAFVIQLFPSVYEVSGIATVTT